MFVSFSMSTFEVPYEFSLHESPVTFTDYIGRCPPSLLEDLYATGSKFRRSISEVHGKKIDDSLQYF